jgi:Cu-Zn family superoxide dismutase
MAVSGEFHGMDPGEHGIHFHSVGKCESQNGFASAGAHFNPANRKRHGLDNPAGPHPGDLPNLLLDSRGLGSYRATTTHVTLGASEGSLFDADGTAVVVHADKDDQRTDPAGNSGIRLACGVVKET